MPGQNLADHTRLLETFGTEGDRFVTEAVRHAPDLPVPTCPGWLLRDLVRHLGSMYRGVACWVTNGRRPADWARDPAPGQSLPDYLRTGLDKVHEAFAGHDPDDYADSWWPADHSYGFWFRRMAHETTIHRVDVENAADGEVTGIADDIATDGVDEALTLWFAHKLPMIGLSGTRTGSVGVFTGGHAWIVRSGPAETAAWRCSDLEAARADARIRGSPPDVYRWLWGRAGFGAVSVEGNHDAVGQLGALLRLATR